MVIVRRAKRRVARGTTDISGTYASIPKNLLST